MVLVECPWCSRLLELDDSAADRLRCQACSIEVELADDRPEPLATAA